MSEACEAEAELWVRASQLVVAHAESRLKQYLNLPPLEEGCAI